MRNFILFLTVLFFNQPLMAQNKTDQFLKDILEKSKSELVRQIVADKDSFRLQVIYTQIDRDKKNQPHFKNYYFNVDKDLYFNPASTVKLPLACLSLEKLHEMKIPGVDKFTTIQFDSVNEKQVGMLHDETSENGYPSIAQFIRKAFLVSDNDAYNRMYQFNTQQRINRRLHAMGYQDIRINRQFLGMSLDENRRTSGFHFMDQNGKIIYSQPEAYNTDSFDFSKIIKMGKGHYNSEDVLVNEPIDFTTVNNLPLEDLQQILQSVLFPAAVSAAQRFHLSKADYHFLYQYLSQFPSETNYPKYDSTQYYDSYVKFYFRNGHPHLPEGVRVFNKVGWAYGFLIDVSYVVDFKNKVEYMLTSTVYVNSDGILNDNHYDYDTVGWPFLYDLGQTIYEYELKRKREFVPDLSQFKIAYEKRNEKDTRPVVKDVDN